jgi:branched-chain amino acid transport system ATP-binding protein
MIEVSDLVVRYGKRRAVDGLSISVAQGDVVLVLGHNGAGKTTLLSAMFGLLRPAEGRIRYRGNDITGRAPRHNVRDGIAFVPQGHSIFRRLTVRENLQLGAFTLADTTLIPARLETVYDFFPVLKERAAQLGGTLSGGQQQMLAIGIALMTRPQLLILDEPSIGLAPNLVDAVMRGIERITREMGTTVVLVEQNIERSLPIAQHAIVIKTGRKVFDGPPASLRDHATLMTYF